MDYYAVKGDIVTCVAGHEIYVVQDHMPFPQINNNIDVSKRELSITRAAHIEQCTPKCSECSMPYARWTNTANMELHFNDGWRNIDGPNRRARTV